MNKTKIILWITLTFFLLLTLPSVIERMKVEWNNNTYEFIIPYEEIEALVTEDPSTLPEVLQQLKKAGLQSIGLEPDTLTSLRDRGEVITITPDRMRETILFSENIDPFIMQDNKGVYVHLLNDLTLINQVKNSFANVQIKTFIINGKEMHFIPGKSGEIMKMPLGFSEAIIHDIRGAGLSFVPRMPNIAEAEQETLIFEKMIALQEETSKKLLLSGADTIGFPDNQLIKSYGNQLLEEGVDIYQIELFDQRGYNTLAYSNNTHVIRLHGINLKEVEEQVATERAVRAVKERNIRSLFIRLDEGERADVLKQTEKFMTNVQADMPKQFKLGAVKSFDDYTVSSWSLFAAFLAAMLFLTLATLEILKNKRLAVVTAGSLAIISIAYSLLKIGALIKGMALLVAIVAPVFAILPLKERQSFKSIFRTYGRAALISFIGILIIVALLNGNEFLVKVDMFKGVKILYVAPIAIVVGYILYGSMKRLALQPIRYWQAAVAIIVGVIIAYYIGRSGNSGTVSQLELSARQMLEQLLYARPRTKEFLIGFPAFLLALYVYPKNKLFGKTLLIPSVIGYLSLVNTFTHFHIPLYVSLIRSGLGLIIGLLIGLLFIYTYKKLQPIYERHLKPRWLS